MKKTKLVLSLSAVAAAFIMAFSTAPKANADILRQTSDPNSPIIDQNDCKKPITNVCGYLFTSPEATEPYDVVEGTYRP